MGEPDVADAYRMGGSTLGLPFLTALVVSARYDRRKGLPAQDGHRLRPADAGLPAPVAAGEGPGGGGRWRLRQARVPAAVARAMSAGCRRHQHCARTRPGTSPRHRGGPARSGWPFPVVGRDCPVPLRCWIIPLQQWIPRRRRTGSDGSTAMVEARFGRCDGGTTAGRRAFDTLRSSSGFHERRFTSFAMHRQRRNPCGYCSGIIKLRWQVEVTFEECGLTWAWKPTPVVRTSHRPDHPRGALAHVGAGDAGSSSDIIRTCGQEDRAAAPNRNPRTNDPSRRRPLGRTTAGAISMGDAGPTRGQIRSAKALRAGIADDAGPSNVSLGTPGDLVLPKLSNI